jgi:hypothetical protein
MAKEQDEGEFENSPRGIKADIFLKDAALIQ